jgi:hypothetical protein
MTLLDIRPELERLGILELRWNVVASRVLAVGDVVFAAAVVGLWVEVNEKAIGARLEALTQLDVYLVGHRRPVGRVKWLREWLLKRQWRTSL